MNEQRIEIPVSDIQSINLGWYRGEDCVLIVLNDGIEYACFTLSFNADRTHITGRFTEND